MWGQRSLGLLGGCEQKFEVVMDLLPNENQVLAKIYLIRDQKVMIDEDLAELYQVETKRLNEQVKRNRERFPKDFMFQLTDEELLNLKSQIATSRWGR